MHNIVVVIFPCLRAVRNLLYQVSQKSFHNWFQNNNHCLVLKDVSRLLAYGPIWIHMIFSDFLAL